MQWFPPFLTIVIRFLLALARPPLTNCKWPKMLLLSFWPSAANGAMFHKFMAHYYRCCLSQSLQPVLPFHQHENVPPLPKNCVKAYLSRPFKGICSCTSVCPMDPTAGFPCLLKKMFHCRTAGDKSRVNAKISNVPCLRHVRWSGRRTMRAQVPPSRHVYHVFLHETLSFSFNSTNVSNANPPATVRSFWTTIFAAVVGQF